MSKINCNLLVAAAFIGGFDFFLIEPVRATELETAIAEPSELAKSPKPILLLPSISSTTTPLEEVPVPDGGSTQAVDLQLSNPENLPDFADQWQRLEANAIAQEAQPEIAPESDIEAEPVKRWRFEVQPTILLPLSISGEQTVDGLIQLSLDDITESLGDLVGDTLSGISLPEGVNLADLLSNLSNLDLGLDLGGGAVFNAINIQTITFDLNLDDVLSLDQVLRLSGRFQAWRDNLGFIFDGQYTRVEQGGDFAIGPLELIGGNGNVFSTGTAEFDADLEFEQGTFDLAVTYRFGDRPVGLREEIENPNFPRLFAEPIAGLRIGILSQNVEIDPGPEIGFDDVYVEPLFGARLGIQVSRRISFGLRGDVSGFGVGSDLTWNFLAGLDWRVSNLISLRTAYRIYDLSYDTEEDGREFDVELQEQGIWLGLTFHL